MRTREEIETAERLLRDLHTALYEGRSVRNGREFKNDLYGLQIALDVLTELLAQKAKEGTHGE